MNRRNFLKSSLFSSTAILGTQINNVNEAVKKGAFIAPKKSTSHGLYVISYGEIIGSRDFPIRPDKAVATEGQLMWFVFPSEKGNARGYLKQYDDSPIETPELIVHRVRMGTPEPPYYLYWRMGNYSMYKTPGSLVKRASWLLHNKSGDEHIFQAMSDFRFATLINIVFAEPDVAESTMNQLVRIDTQIRQDEIVDFNYYIDMYKELLTQSR